MPNGKVTNLNQETEKSKISKSTQDIYNDIQQEIKRTGNTKKDEKGRVTELKFNELKDTLNRHWKEFSTTDRILKAIRKRSDENLDATFEDLYSLVAREDLIWTSIQKLNQDKGSVGTAGINKRAHKQSLRIDRYSNSQVKNLRMELKTGTYKFMPVKKIMYLKLGKKEKKLLSISTFKDKIIQEAIRRILEEIYEPIFEKVHRNTNYGFRTNKYSQDAIALLIKQAKGMEWCIEGDIKGGYNNVNHDILLNILSDKIKDKKFLKLIDNGLKSGLIFQGNSQHTILGTLQGGIVSPLLFNIYMSKLDEYVLKNVNEYVNDINNEQNRKSRPVTTNYKTISGRFESVRKQLKILKNRNENGSHTWPIAERNKKRELVTKIRNLKQTQLQLPYIDKKRANIRICYVRYADDWVLFTNSSFEITNNIKEKIKNYLKAELKLELSLEKTKITNVNQENINFLGFSLGNYYNARKITKTKDKITQRTTGRTLIVGIDYNKIITRYKAKGYVTEDGKRGKRSTILSTRSDFEIIRSFNYMIRGILKYYGKTINSYYILSRILYILYYSCIHTLAAKHKVSIRKIIRTYGTPIMASKTMEHKTEKEILISYLKGKEIVEQWKRNKIDVNTELDFTKLVIN